MRGSREISLVPSLHRASTDALIIWRSNFVDICVLFSGNKKLSEKLS